jgi:hypothetical protein
MYLVCTCSETCFTGFWAVLRDANILVPDAQQPPADQDIDAGDPCPEDDTSNKAMQIKMYRVPNQNIDFSWIVTALQGGKYCYRQVQVVLYYSIVRTIAALCHTKYAQSLYSEVDLVAGLWCHCDVAVWECCGHNPARVRTVSTYCVRTQYIMSTYCVVLVCT